MDQHDRTPQRPTRTEDSNNARAAKAQGTSPQQASGRRRRSSLGISDAEIVRELSATSR